MKMIEAVERAKAKMKKIEAKHIPVKFRENSAWLQAVNDIIDRTALAIVDELNQE